MDDSNTQDAALTDGTVTAADRVAPTEAGSPPSPEDTPPEEQAPEIAAEPSAAHRVMLEIEGRFHHLELLPQATATWFREKLAELKSLL